MNNRLADRGYIDTNLWVPKRHFNVEGVKRALTFTYLEGKDREPTDLPLYRETDHHLVVPREFWPRDRMPFDIVDCRPTRYVRSPVRSKIKLDHKRLNDGSLVPTGSNVQQQALQAMMDARGGILQLACGKGKTVIFLELIARLGVPALIVVDNTQLLEQWSRAINDFLDVPGGVGLIQEQTFDWKKWVVLATYQTLARRAATMPEEVRRWFGVVGWDEAHHVNAPTFSRSADLFYGRRYGLTATPTRDDGLHVIHEFNFGGVLYRDLMQDLRPRIYFTYTGLELNMMDPDVVAATCTAMGELHLSKLAVYFGQWRPRLDFILKEIRTALAEDRKVLVLSNSVDELVNLLSLWNGNTRLYTDLTVDPSEIGETAQPQELSDDAILEFQAAVDNLEEAMQQPGLSKAEYEEMAKEQHIYRAALTSNRVYEELSALLRKKQREYITRVLRKDSDAGLMIHRVDPKQRMKMLEEKKVTFAIMKYGKEGLDNPALDTVIILEPMGSRNMLQQVMGRVLRHKEGKKAPVVVVLEDNIGPLLNMCQKMRKHLRSWPVEDGGPYAYEMLNHPKGRR